jgi:predicted 2-oxoglutarate/Fe(II)-dependent dioxygenase YbiX
MFLVSRYREGGYFAPHFDGAMLWDDPVTAQKSQSAFTVVLYLSDDFEGGATHYLPVRVECYSSLDMR